MTWIAPLRAGGRPSSKARVNVTLSYICHSDHNYFCRFGRGWAKGSGELQFEAAKQLHSLIELPPCFTGHIVSFFFFRFHFVANNQTEAQHSKNTLLWFHLWTLVFAFLLAAGFSLPFACGVLCLTPCSGRLPEVSLKLFRRVVYFVLFLSP